MAVDEDRKSSALRFRSADDKGCGTLCDVPLDTPFGETTKNNIRMWVFELSRKRDSWDRKDPRQKAVPAY